MQLSTSKALQLAPFGERTMTEDSCFWRLTKVAARETIWKSMWFPRDNIKVPLLVNDKEWLQEAEQLLTLPWLCLVPKILTSLHWTTEKLFPFAKEENHNLIRFSIILLGIYLLRKLPRSSANLSEWWTYDRFKNSFFGESELLWEQGQH